MHYSRRQFIQTGVAAALATTAPASLGSVSVRESARVFKARDFGLAGDGIRDDGDALQRMLKAARSTSVPVILKFEAGHCYYIATGEKRYAFWLDGVRNWTIDGGGSIFLIDGALRFLSLTNSRQVRIARLKVDYSPLPFVDGLVVAKDAAAGTVDVSIDEGVKLPQLGGPSHSDGEQAFFGMFRYPGPYSTPDHVYLTVDYFFVQGVHQAAPVGSGQVVRVLTSKPSAVPFDRIVTGLWRMSIPVPGLAHCLGPGHTCHVENNRDVHFENVDIWSAPWFAFGIIGNTGELTFRHTHVRPKPGTTRLTSSWRDGFHVKNNRASLLWEDCIVQGTNDDAFNISEHTSSVVHAATATDLTIRQIFPLGIAAMQVGDRLVAYDKRKARTAGSARIKAIAVEQAAVDGSNPVAPLFHVSLDRPFALAQPEGALIWNDNDSNPNTVLRRCRIDESCRFRSAVTLEQCEINALSWFTGELYETPISGDVVVRDCTLRTGYGNPRIAVAIDAPVFDGKAPEQPVLRNYLFAGNKIWGDVVLHDCEMVAFEDNTFFDHNAHLDIRNVASVLMRDNIRCGQALSSLSCFPGAPASVNGVRVAITSPGAPCSLMKPFAAWRAAKSGGGNLLYHAIEEDIRPIYRVDAGCPNGDCYEVRLPVTEAGLPIILEEFAEPGYSVLTLSAYVYPGTSAACKVTVSTPHGGAGEAILPVGVWRSHRFKLPGATVGGPIWIALAAAHSLTIPGRQRVLLSDVKLLRR